MRTRAVTGDVGDRRLRPCTPRKTARRKEPRAFAGSIHAVHVPTDTTVISYTYIRTRRSTRRSGGRVKFTCSTKDIASAVGAASKIVNAHTTVPILSNVLLTADEGGIKVRATDLELTLEQSFPAEIAEHGSGHRAGQAVLAATSATCRPGLLELSGTPTRAIDQSRTLELRFSRPAAGRVSAAAERAKGRRRSRSPRKKFRDGVNSTIFAASSEEARGAVLMGTLLELEVRSITLVATDGYRLAKWTSHARPPVRRLGASTSFPRARWPKPPRNLGAAEMLEATALGAQANQLMLTAGTTSHRGASRRRAVPQLRTSDSGASSTVRSPSTPAA